MTSNKILTGIACMITLLLLFDTNSCNYPSSQKEQSKIEGKKPSHGSRFEAFVSTIESLPVTERDTAAERFISELPQTPVIESDSTVSLYWYGKAISVSVNGDLQQGWSAPDPMARIDCGDNAFFHITYIVPPDSRLDYQLVIDTITVTDPRNPVITPSGYGPHSEIAMPGFKPDPARQFRTNVPHGTIDSLLFASKDTTFRPRQVKVYVPANYSNLSQLPVLYVLDGLEAMEYMSYPVVLDNLIADQRIEPVLVVFIPPGERHTEYIGEKQEAFMQALCNEFVPLIDQTYKTTATAEKRGIAGISSGGHMALLMVLSHPGVFRNGAGQSPTLSHHIEKALKILQKSARPLPGIRIYLDAGRYDLVSGSVNGLSFLQATVNFHQTLQQAGINHLFKVINDGHEWANWRERTDEILEYFYGMK
jgi:enterochelin esterase-like enzyme